MNLTEKMKNKPEIPFGKPVEFVWNGEVKSGTFYGTNPVVHTIDVMSEEEGVLYKDVREYELV